MLKEVIVAAGLTAPVFILGYVSGHKLGAGPVAAAPDMLAALKAFPSVTIDMRKSARHNAKEIIATAVWAQEYCAPAIAKAEGRAV